TSNQVQINTLAPSFAPLEMEKYVTFPIEVAMSNLPKKEEIRSISQFGLSQVTITFADDVDIYWARQMVLERLIEAERELPPGISPELAPISTGLGEIYQFTLEVKPDSKKQYSLMDLRTFLDWYVKPELRTVPGVVEVNSFGGKEKQYEVRVDPDKLMGYGLSLNQVIKALEENNMNAGGAYIERGGEQEIIRGVGLIGSIQDIEKIVVDSREGVPVQIQKIADVGFASQVRQGAATENGKGETVMGMTMLLKGENARTVTKAVEERLGKIQKTLPEGVVIRPFYNRSDLVNQTIHTASKNLLEGGILVVIILFLFLLQLRAGLIVSSAIPLSMLFAIIGMNYFGITANLMSLGAIDFGLIVDGAVIIVENSVRKLAMQREELGSRLSDEERRRVIHEASVEVLKPAIFGMLIIITAYVPILTLGGIEGKMFRPMAFTVILALLGALLLSFTLIPALCAVFLRDHQHERENKVLNAISKWYESLLRTSVRRWGRTVLIAVVLVVACLAIFPFLGSEFLPELDEGSIAINHVRLKSVSLTESVRQTLQIEKALRQFPEVDTVVSRIGRPEIATDPMGPDMVDTYVFLKPKSQWGGGVTKEDLISKISERLEEFPGIVSSFSQPIKFRMMELIEGVGARSDVVIKIYGDDMHNLSESGNRIAAVLKGIKGANDVKVQQITGLPVMQIEIDRDAVARHGINVSDVREVIQSAIAGTQATEVLEGFMRFALVVRYPEWARSDRTAIGNLLVSAPGGQQIPLSQLAKIRSEVGPAEISRENGRRFITIESNIRGRDIGSFVSEAQKEVDAKVQLPPAYRAEWSGTFEHLESGRQRLLIVVPITFFLIFLLLFGTFHSLKQALLVFTGIPFAVTGGVLALLIRSMHFSMSAGIGFIAVSGVAVLNGVVMLTFINQLRHRDPHTSVEESVVSGALVRLRPVLMT
ncbi:CusA/CzcA family heavy metal efflux RND transporter, partial [bacterium]|nr:CusA/CzcA family heavy metal efflux RND transporter [bacterium]